MILYGKTAETKRMLDTPITHPMWKFYPQFPSFKEGRRQYRKDHWVGLLWQSIVLPMIALGFLSITIPSVDATFDKIVLIMATLTIALLWLSQTAVLPFGCLGPKHDAGDIHEIERVSFLSSHTNRIRFVRYQWNGGVDPRFITQISLMKNEEHAIFEPTTIVECLWGHPSEIGLLYGYRHLHGYTDSI